LGIEALIHAGRPIAIFQHRRLKELPYSGGYAVTAIAERPDPKLVDAALVLLGALRWEGVAMVEFRLNRTTGEAVLMEVNGRYWGTISLPVSAGVDFPLYHWQLLHGEKPSVPITGSEGKLWRWTSGYLDRLSRLLITARWSSAARRELKQTLLQMPADFNPAVADAIFASSDPVPAAFDLLHGLKYVVGNTLKGLSRRIPSLSTITSRMVSKPENLAASTRTEGIRNR
jgi:predicted ATP-grasp superfamily ATP-dependent carboligase